MKIEELIRGYYNHQLNFKQEQVFISKYKNDEIFRQLSNQIKLELLAARALGRDELKSDFKKWENPTPVSAPVPTPVIEQQSPVVIFFKEYYKYGIAASFVLMIGLYFFISPDSDNIYSTYYEPYANFEYAITRTEIPDSEKVKQQAYSFYDKGQYSQAVQQFSFLLEKNPNDDASHFFRGICFMELVDPYEALEDLIVVSKGYHVYYQKAAIWYMALIKIKLNRNKEAVILLKKISTQKGEFRRKAVELLKELEE